MPRPGLEIGSRYGRLTVLGASHVDSAGRRHYRFACDCGREIVKRGSRVKAGDTRSCGCLLAEHARAVGFVPNDPRSAPVQFGPDNPSWKHGHAGTKDSPTYRSWRAMRERCTNPKARHFNNYGGRGIAVCDRWRDFEMFLDDMGERPEGKTLDRIDVNGNYEPGNCRWATAKEQRANQRQPPHAKAA